MPKILTFNDPHSPLNSPLRKLQRFGRRRTLSLAVFFFGVLMLPIVMLAVQQQTALKQHAASTQVVFVDANNAEITQTTSPTVKVKITSPYAIALDETQQVAQSTNEYLAVLGQATAVYQVNSSFNDVNEVNRRLDPAWGPTASRIWLGNGGRATGSYTGLRFTNIGIPRGTVINSAHLAVQAADNTWIQMKFKIAAENSANSQVFSAQSLPSQRTITSATVNHSSDVRWSANNWYTLNEMKTIIQEVVNRPDWKAGNSISIILRGTGGAYGRKFVRSFDGSPANAPKLLVTYSTDTTAPSSTPTATNTPIPPTATPTQPTTPVAATVSIANFAFQPQNITVKVGDTIRWTNNDTVSHTVTSDTGIWTAPTLAPGQSFTHTFTQGGIFMYHCTLHPSMTGMITVQSTNATSTPVPSPTPTTVPVTTESITLAEDPNFTQNVRTISPITTNPTYTNYTFSNATAGTKLLFVRFTSSTGQQQDFSNSITLTQIAQNPTPTTPPSGGQDGQNSMAMGIWTPNIKYDTCPSYPAGITTDQQKSDYIKSIHDNYKVKGPDGKWYPTWHPAIDPTTGCKFGHEHGADPKTSPMWDTVQTNFAYDADHNGTIDATEKQTAGLPFGYVNEQLDLYSQAQGVSMMRHEDHVGHKVAVENNVDVKRSITGGTQIAVGVKCNYLTKVHQGVHSKDAFSNNLHEVVHFAKCDDGQDLRLARMAAFGKAGEFSIVNICGSRIDQAIVTGFSNSNPLYPGSRQDGSRGIMDRACVEDVFFVPQGQWSGFPYETWTTSLNFTSSTGKALVRSIDFLFDVFDSIRYYYPGQPNDLGYMTNTFSESFPNPASGDGVNKWRGGAYDLAGPGTAWDSISSPFRDLKRGVYFKPGDVQNSAGPTYWYTDPFGGKGQATPFPGSVRQYIVQRDINYSLKYGSPTDPTVVIRQYTGTGVHAPN